MIAHLFKLIWNKKKQNFLIMLELFFSFLIMFAVFTLILNYYRSYNAQRGFEHEDVWTINRTAASSAVPIARDSAILLDQLLLQQIRSMPSVTAVSYSTRNTPYAGNRAIINLVKDNMKVHADIFTVDDNYANLLQLQMQSGRWFSREEDGASYTPVVINAKLKEKFFGQADAQQQLINFNGKNYKVIGVVKNLKNAGDYVEPENGFYTRADSSFYGNNNTILVKVKPGTDANFESRLFRTVSNMAHNTTVDIDHLENRRIKKNQQLLIPVIMILIVTLFFVINVALGLFGVLWHNINKRRGEIGLRRAIGASASDIAKQMVGEAMVLCSLSIIAGTFFAIQFPLLNILDLPANTYLGALLLDVVFLYVFVFLCALYPGRQAAAIYPAVALHEE